MHPEEHVQRAKSESGPNLLKHVSVCICAFRRPALLAKLLTLLSDQTTNGDFSLSVVVVDNDSAQSSRNAVDLVAGKSHIDITYRCEPRQNIALARNEAVRNARGDFVAFIDDDEFPQSDWLATMIGACERLGAAGVLGPVRPHFEEQPPRWIIDGGFCERPEYPTGRIMSWSECRTGNVVFRREIVTNLNEPFDPAFGSGGEDVDFFRRMIESGHIFRWCNEGAVYEAVPKERLTRGYFLRRALLRGRNNLKLPDRARRIVTSCVAAPAYLAILPVALMLGQHVFMKYAIRLCDHAGRLLAALRINPVHER